MSLRFLLLKVPKVIAQNVILRIDCMTFRHHVSLKTGVSTSGIQIEMERVIVGPFFKVLLLGDRITRKNWT